MTPEPAGRPVPESSEAVPWHLLEPTLLAVWLETDLQQGLEADEVERFWGHRPRFSRGDKPR